MRNIIFLWRIIVVSLMLSQTVYANETILKRVYSNNVFYNLLEHTNGTIYVGGSNGLYEIKNNILKKINDESGYVVFKNNQITRNSYFGVEVNYKYKSILPANYEDLSHQSVVRGSNIYLICRGDLFIYEIKPYKFNLKGKSIRCFSDNSIGTYSGVFIYGKNIQIPNYTSGDIFERDSTFYICYDGLAIYSPKKGTKLFRRENTNETQIGNVNLGFSREIMQFNDGGFLLSSTTGLHLIDSAFVNVQTIFESKYNIAPVIIDVVDAKHEKIISFGSANKFYNYSVNQEDLFLKETFRNSIVDGFKLENDIVGEYVLLLNDEVIIYNNFDSVSKNNVVGLKEAHSIISIGKDTTLITSQDGAHLLYLKSKEISPLMFEGVEFNKRALSRKGNVLKLGSTEGFIEINKSDLIKICNDLIKKSDNRMQTTFNIWFIVIFVSFISVLGMLVYVRKKPKLFNNEVEKEITRIDIEVYIQSNLKNVSIKSIKNFFNISNKGLYKIIAPDKPGAIISNHRKVKAKELILKGVSLKGISEETGFSLSYLRKIK